LTEEPENGETVPTEESAQDANQAPRDEQSARADSSADAAPPVEPPAEATDEQAPEAPPAAEPVAEAPADDEATDAASEPEAEGDGDASTRAPSGGASEAEGSAPVDAATSVSDAEPAEEEFVAEEPRAKPEIPGADLEVFLPEQEDQYVDAEARAAAEAEAEAEAARAQAEAEDLHSKPIADATIDLAAGARYTATGKRKTAVARVILKPGNGTYAINGKPLNEFFPRETLQRMIRQPLESVGYESRMEVVARMHGGGVAAQAGALRHGISRALIVADPHLRGELKRRGFLTRDPRVKERKKAGLKKARKRPQFSKR
jgi:small subunit ribosomal protein S9